MEKSKDWKIVAHSHQIADTGDYNGCYELTNGKISIYTQDDEDFKPVIDALNESGCDFYLDDSAEFELHILKEENKLLHDILDDPEKYKEWRSLFEKTDTADYWEKIQPYHHEIHKKQYTLHLLEVYLLYGIQSNELDIQIYYRSQNLLAHAVQQ